jgi:hypothetical protein
MVAVGCRRKFAASAVFVVGLLLAGHASAAVLYGIDDSTNSLVTINQTNGAVSVVGSTGVATGNYGDLTYDSNDNVLYWAAGRGNDNLYSLNQTTGAATLIGNTGITDLFGLAYDTTNNVLYGESADSGNFYSIDAHTGDATLIGATLISGVGGLAYVAATDTLYMTQAGSGGLYTVNITNAEAAEVGPGAGFLNDDGITWDPLDSLFWTDDWSDNIYQYDAAFDSRTLVNTNSDPLDGIAFVGGGNVNVPEPLTLSLFGAGLVGAFAMRRRKKLAGD